MAHVQEEQRLLEEGLQERGKESCSFISRAKERQEL